MIINCICCRFHVVLFAIGCFIIASVGVWILKISFIKLKELNLHYHFYLMYYLLLSLSLVLFCSRVLIQVWDCKNKNNSLLYSLAVQCETIRKLGNSVIQLRKSQHLPVVYRLCFHMNVRKMHVIDLRRILLCLKLNVSPLSNRFTAYLVLNVCYFAFCS